MKLIGKNLNSDGHSVEIKSTAILITVTLRIGDHYDRIFLEGIIFKSYAEGLEKILKRVQKKLGLKLIENV